ncbi:hypothetical protein OROMI_020823 [Orobanche minor]
MKVKRRRALEVVGPNTKVEVATFYLTIHFYNLKRALQHVAHSAKIGLSPWITKRDIERHFSIEGKMSVL